MRIFFIKNSVPEKNENKYFGLLTIPPFLPQSFCYAPTLKKWGAYGFQLVCASLCPISLLNQKVVELGHTFLKKGLFELLYIVLSDVCFSHGYIPSTKAINSGTNFHTVSICMAAISNEFEAYCFFHSNTKSCYIHGKIECLTNVLGHKSVLNVNCFHTCDKIVLYYSLFCQLH